MAIVLVIVAPELTIILFGETWLPIVPVFRLMLVYVVLNPLYVNLSYLIVGIGRPTLLARVRLIQVGIFVATVAVFAHFWGINGVAIAANLMMLIGTSLLMIYSQQFTGFSISRMLFWPTVAATASFVVSYVLLENIQAATIWHTLVFKTLLASGIYMLILYAAERQMINELITIYRNKALLEGKRLIHFVRERR
jgi:PST family polysaccharide transporter